MTISSPAVAEKTRMFGKMNYERLEIEFRFQISVFIIRVRVRRSSITLSRTRSREFLLHLRRLSSLEQSWSGAERLIAYRLRKRFTITTATVGCNPATLFPESFRQRQAGKIFLGQPSVGLDAEAFQDRDQLPRVLRRMPGRSLEQLEQRLHAIKGSHLLLTRIIFELFPPVLEPLDHVIAVTCDLRAGNAASVSGRNVGVIESIFDIVDASLKKSLRDTKNMMAQEPDRTVSVIDDAFGEPIVWELQNIALSRPQYPNPFGNQDRWRQRCVTAALQTDELGNIFEILTENILISLRQHWHAACAESRKVLLTLRVVQHINRNEANALLRKKLFRSKATASTGLGKQ